MKNNSLALFFVLLSAASLVLFQNCGADINTSDYQTAGSSNSSSTSGGPVTAAPSITSQSPNVNTSYLSSFSIAVSASGGGLSYQWYKDGNILSGKNAATLDFTNALESDSGIYTAEVSNSSGSASADITVLIVRSSSQFPPQITTQVAKQTVGRFRIAYTPSTVTVSTSALRAEKYEWYFKQNGTANFVKLPHTGSSFTISLGTYPNGEPYFGAYKVVVTNAYGSVESIGGINSQF